MTRNGAERYAGSEMENGVLRELTYSEFKKCFGKKMNKVTSQNDSRMDIWGSIEPLVHSGVLEKYTFENKSVECVYRTEDNHFEHCLLPTSAKNVFVVIITDLILKTIHGFYKLDLNKEYGLS